MVMKNGGVIILMALFILPSIRPLDTLDVITMEYGDKFQKESIVSDSIPYYPDYKTVVEYVMDHYEEEDIIISIAPYLHHQYYSDHPIDYILRTGHYVESTYEEEERVYDIYSDCELLTEISAFFDILKNFSRVWLITSNDINNKKLINDQVQIFIKMNHERIVYRGDHQDDRVYLFQDYKNTTRLSVGDYDSLNPSVATSNNCSIFSWDDRRNGVWEIFITGYKGSGEQHIEETKLTPSSNSYSASSSIAEDSDGNSYVVWQENVVFQDEMAIRSRIYLSKVDQNGNKVWREIPISFSESDNSYAQKPQIVIDSKDNIHVIYQLLSEEDGNGNLYYTKLLNNGSISIFPFALTNDLANNINPSISVDDQDQLHIVWQDGREGSYQIYYSKLDGNSTTSINLTVIEPKRISSHANESFEPDIALYGTHLHAVWQDQDENDKTITTIQYLQMDLNGNVTHDQIALTFQYATREDEKLEKRTEVANPAIASSDGRNVISWQDNRIHNEFGDGYWNIYYKILDGNGKILANDTRVSYFQSNSITPDVAISGKTVHIVWADDLPQNYEILHKEIEIP